MNEDKLLKAAEHAIYESISKMLANDYRGPVSDAVKAVAEKHQEKLNAIVENAYLSVLDSDSFADSVKLAMNDKLARCLVSGLGGEVEKRVNELKADPVTRAKITLALTEIISS